MNHKVLLADDSLTIQKVIKITLANQPYDITEASSEDELFHKLPVVQPKLVFLDFNLSEKYTGYELTTKIKSMWPSAKVLLLLGTFDTVDDASMEKCGASDKIVKPFDSNKFIAICKQLIDTFADSEEEIDFPEAETKTMPAVNFHSEEDQWTVSHTTEQKFPEQTVQKDVTLPYIENPLLKEVSDWGMSVPGVINDASSDSTIELPPVIGEEVKSAPAAEQKAAPARDSKFDVKYPDNNDLDYPTIEEMNAASESAPAAEAPKATSKLISIDSFNTKPLEMDTSMHEPFVSDDSEVDIKSLEAQIMDEVEDNLWQADEFEDLKKEVSSKIEEVKSNFQPTLNDFDESLFKPIDDSDSVTWNDAALTPSKPEPRIEPAFTTGPASVNLDEMRSEMEAMVKKYVKEYMDQMFQKNAEKVAWEVIPDLAENLIRQELSKISNKIINE